MTLNQDGHLMLGHSESMALEEKFASKGQKIFKKI
ncbi:MAG: hypothetical protein HOI53_07850 [Francisellaceae bacterium]|nr:hypothetical protein [Francisellaceae bacterium]MBT6539784.1 hypothetical protein [Francisellaceae bacterium]